MIQLLARATRLIACLARQPEGLALHQLAAAAEVPPSTCVRLLRDLVELGWADQRGARGIYRLGPQATVLTREQPYRGRLLTVARPAVESIVRRHGWQAILAVMRGERRLVVLRGEADGRDPVCLAEERELYASASGRLLVAHLDWRVRRRLVAAIGMPTQAQWPGVGTWAELGSECTRIRRAGAIVNIPRHGEVNAVAVAIADRDGGTAALAIAMPKHEWDEAALTRIAQAAAQRIARGLS